MLKVATKKIVLVFSCFSQELEDERRMVRLRGLFSGDWFLKA